MSAKGRSGELWKGVGRGEDSKILAAAAVTMTWISWGTAILAPL